jgi:hypothetical protein
MKRKNTMRKLTIAACTALVAASSTQPVVLAQGFAHVSAIGDVIDVRADSVENALNHAIHELRQVCRCVISYEGPEWTYSGDVQQKSDGRGGTITNTRKRTLHASVPGTLPLTRETATDIVLQLIAEDERGSSSARYQVTQGRALEIRAVRVKNQAGVEVDADLLLDTPISIARGTLDVATWISRIGFELQRRTGKQVLAGVSAGAPFSREPIALDANDEPARIVLERLLSSLHYPAGWNIMYIPAIKTHSLTIVFQRVQA